MKLVTGQENRYDWPLCYEAEEYIQQQLASFTERNAFTKELEQRMRDETGTLLVDWIDHIVLSLEEEPVIRALGYWEDFLGETHAGQAAYWHPEAMLPRLVLDSATSGEEHCPARLALRVDNIADFMSAHYLQGEPVGEPLSRYRHLAVAQEANTRLEVVERHGYRGYLPAHLKPMEAERLLKACEMWKTRPRRFADDAEGYAVTHRLLDQLVELVGRNRGCHLIFAEERAYWERRNHAARIQKQRQDKLGLGWANHDHHTFRSSRPHFVDLMLALDKLGFERRERYYAGAQAGWGAQILEHPVENIIAFCDVDLEPQETEIDFSRQHLPPSKKLGTIGLWVGLHGESFLDAGMHHLECRFDYGLLREQLADMNIGTMNPFSDFPFLKQAFTEGEHWPVRRERAERLLAQGLIDERQFKHFLSEGALGSHLENLQRKGGFKGFNQQSVSAIIQATDPRRRDHAFAANA